MTDFVVISSLTKGITSLQRVQNAHQNPKIFSKVLWYGVTPLLWV